MSNVSVVIPSYNHAAFLEERLVSILNQTFKNFEVIIIDDCSTDNSVNIIKQFITNNPAFKVKHFIVNEVNSGSGYTSWQKGVELAETPYVWIAETDDFSHKDFLKKQVEILDKHKNTSLVFCGSNYMNQKGEYLYNSTNRTRDLNVPTNSFKIFDSKIFIDRMPFSTYITNGSSVVFRKPKQAIPKELFSFKQSSDQFFWTFLIKNNSFAFLNKNLNFFRRHDGSTTVKISKTRQKQVYLEKINYINYFKLPRKYKEFIKHYIKYFVHVNRFQMFNSSLILKIENVKNLRLKYFELLFKFYIAKIIKRFNE
ncbi:glycosyltransferase [Lutibacter sp. TH_r2]|uniref:glycosyltransferase family 2 protein n=1 Tax=Lutibacter sp. TH_r2 TaxID=3082083 RepID=UPI002953B010|nr:glycosyltransferase [Lutibacter sp. TH_r2]MDV7187445.1 glycosyltransferase [Lutibacter sp. TH_r2]